MTQTPEPTPAEPTVPMPRVEQPTQPIPPAAVPPPAAARPVAMPPVPGPGEPYPARPVPASYPMALPPAGATPGTGMHGAEAPAQRSPRRRGWVPVVSAAAVAAVLASAGTAGVVSLLDHDGGTQPVSTAQLGKTPDTTPHTVPVASSTSENPDWEAVTKAVSPSVVAIQVSTSQGGAEGSGVIVDAEGHVLTNNHVVSGAEQMQVSLSDGRIYDAKIIGTDPTSDLAVVQIQNAPKDLVPATLGDSDKVAVGESVLAVGNPLGLANSATTGIVSAVDRPVSASGESGGEAVVTNAIQIDAAVNPGNSGGPLFNAQGEVIGITSSIASLSGGSSQSGSIGLGFAIPVDLAKNIGQQLITSGKAEHAFLGVSLTDATATADGVTRRGTKVEKITADSPAASAGIATGDIVVAIDGQPVSGKESLTGFVREKAAGDVVKVTLVRDGKAQDIQVTLAAKAAETTNPQGSDGSGSGQQGSDGSGQSDPSNPNNLPWQLGGNG